MTTTSRSRLLTSSRRHLAAMVATGILMTGALTACAALDDDSASETTDTGTTSSDTGTSTDLGTTGDDGSTSTGPGVTVPDSSNGNGSSTDGSSNAS